MELECVAEVRKLHSKVQGAACFDDPRDWLGLWIRKAVDRNEGDNDPWEEALESMELLAQMEAGCSSMV